MATYAIGDVHGCFRTLGALLERLPLDLARDRIWLVGDLVNRGPRSLETLRWAVEHDDRVTAVLGNHDLHLLAIWNGVVPHRKKDTLLPVLEAKDRDDLLAWLRSRPLLHLEDGALLVHAGLRPAWSAQRAARAAERAAREVARPETLRLLRTGSSQQRAQAPQSVRDLDFLTRVRVVDHKGEPSYDYTGPPASRPRGTEPWFSLPDRRHADQRVIFGHWAALGYHREPGILGLDSGCAWGGPLTAVRLDDETVFSVANRDLRPAG